MNHAAIDAVLTSAIASGVAPGIAAIAVNREGVIYEGAAGLARVAENVPMRTGTITAIASMTKAITSFAALQCVDRGLLSLDSPAAQVLPVLGQANVLENGKLRPAVTPITLRQLLSHTSGHAYPFTSADLVEYLKGRVPGADGPQGPPLLAEPGTRWQYGVGTDWTGRLVAAASGKGLDVFMSENILGPLGMEDTGFSVPMAKADRVATIHNRSRDGVFSEQPLTVPEPPAEPNGGGGLHSTARDYARFLQLILRDGEHEGKRLLSAEGMEGLRSPQPATSAAGGWRSAGRAFSNDTDFTDEGHSRHSLGFLVSGRDGATGRKAGTLAWGGIFNTYYWIDPASGLAGATVCQFLPFFDAGAMATLAAFEREIYRAFA